MIITAAAAVASAVAAIVGISSSLCKRQDSEHGTSICGYENGEVTLPRVAAPGFECRVDEAAAVWGFCPTAVEAVTDCWLVSACFDAHYCTTGCGRTTESIGRSITCEDTHNCRQAMLTMPDSQSYTYYDCALGDQTQHYDLLPRTAEATPTEAASEAPVTSAAAPQDPEPTMPGYAPPAVPQTSDAAVQTSANVQPVNTQAADVPSSGAGSSSPSDSRTDAITNTPTSLAIDTTLIPSTIPIATEGSTTVATIWQSTASSTVNNTPAIVGGVVGGFALLSVTVLASVILWRRQSKSKKTRHEVHEVGDRPSYDDNVHNKEYRYAPSGLQGRQHAPLVEVSGIPVRTRADIGSMYRFDPPGGFEDSKDGMKKGYRQRSELPS